MNFELTDDQQAFADMAAGLFADYCGDEQLRAHDSGQAPFMQDLWKQCIAAGLQRTYAQLHRSLATWR